MTSTYWNLDERPPQFTYEGKNAIGLPWLILDSGLPLVLKGFNCHGSFASLHLQEQHEHDLEDSQTSNVHSSLLRRYINQRQEHSFPLASPENNKLSSSTCNNNNNNNHSRSNNAIFRIDEKHYCGFQYLPFHPALHPTPSPGSPLSSKGSPRSPLGSSRSYRKGNLSSVFSGSSSTEHLHLWAAVFAGALEGKEEANIFVEPFLSVTDVSSINEEDEKDPIIQVSISTAHVGPLTPRAFVGGELFVCLAEDGSQHSVLAYVVDNDETSFTLRVPAAHVTRTSIAPARPSSSSESLSTRNSEGRKTLFPGNSASGSINGGGGEEDQESASLRSLDQLSIHSSSAVSNGKHSNLPIRVGDTILPSPPGCTYFRYMRTIRLVPNTLYTSLTSGDETPFSISPFRISGNRTYTSLGSPHGSERIRTFINPEDHSLFFRQGKINFSHCLPPLATGFFASAEVINSATVPDMDKASSVLVSMDGSPRPHASVGRRKVSDFGQGITVPFENVFANGRQVAWIAVNHFNSAARISIRGWIE